MLPLTEEELSAKKAKEAKQFQWLYITVAISIVVSVAAFYAAPYALAKPSAQGWRFWK